jgi:leucyl/phenylalanyl-tRNA--protein transferase
LTDEDLFAVTSELTVEDLIMAYDVGVFPWPDPSLKDIVPWFKPTERGVIFFDRLHAPESFKKFLKKTKFTVTFCQDFSGVIESCANAKRKGQSSTWINKSVLEAYTELFRRKRAYSVEVWSQNELVGGLYGVISERYISGESMFFKETGASKFALYKLIKKLEKMGLSYIDTQMVTPVVQAFGGVKISKEDFEKLLFDGKIRECSTLFDSLKEGA